MKPIKPSLVIPFVASLMLLISCNLQKNMPWVRFDDTILSHEYTDNLGTVTGIRGYYLTYGAIQLKGEQIKAGDCVLNGPPYLAHYCIKDLIKLHPELDNFQVETAISKQQC